MGRGKDSERGKYEEETDEKEQEEEDDDDGDDHDHNDDDDYVEECNDEGVGERSTMIDASSTGTSSWVYVYARIQESEIVADRATWRHGLDQPSVQGQCGKVL